MFFTFKEITFIWPGCIHLLNIVKNEKDKLELFRTSLKHTNDLKTLVHTFMI